MTKSRQKRCPKCGKLNTIKWGKQNGHQRYKCKLCNVLFTDSRKNISQQNRFVWFEKWILGKQSIRQLSEASGYSEKTLRNYFNIYLNNSPQWVISKTEKVHLMIDGTYFKNKVCLVLYRDFNVRATLMYRLTNGEWEKEIREDLNIILSLGITIESVTCDGHSSIINSIKKTDKQIKIQRCLVHIQRESLIWLTKRPKSNAGKYLRYIASGICSIKTHDDMRYWLWFFNRWSEEYHDYVNVKSHSSQSDNFWYTHKMVRKSYVHIKRALPFMFCFLDNSKIPNNTNSLESFFGHLKQNISLHRGLSRSHYKNYLKWYLHFRNNDSRK